MHTVPMPPRSNKNISKGKKRAFEEVKQEELAVSTPRSTTVSREGSIGSGNTTPKVEDSHDVEPERKFKKPKRAETRVCPVCEDTIPVRLLASHEIFELQRVEEICQARPDEEGLVPWEQIEEGSAGPSRRGAALKARRSINAPSSSSHQPSSSLSARVTKTIRLIQKHRRDRHAKLKELSRADIDRDEGVQRSGNICPVCQVRITTENFEGHVDACLASMGEQIRDNGADLAADGLEQYEIGGETRIRISGSVDPRGAGYDVRNPDQPDVEEEIDIDGDEEAAFGGIQFTERDIIPVNGRGEDEEVQIDSDEEDGAGGGNQRVGTSLRELVAQGKVVLQSQSQDKPNGAQSTAILTTDISELGAIMCRICLDPYTDPTVSTGCWHTCCKECWLRCLGSTKLCPICKRITAASDLRRIYL
ncbi:hypothetical protein M422DRAFT_23119 [Sphaerobolus stellatus SS14]|nr:hypothetical protein M422DRAFT_23119 [Sphaerobolus stellatus SS14]